MSEINRYFSELRRDIKSKTEVASVRTVDATRKHAQFEERTFEVFLKKAYQSSVTQVRMELILELQESVEIPEESVEYDLQITATYDGSV